MEQRRLVSAVVLLLLSITGRAAADPVMAGFRVTVTFVHGDFETFFFTPIRPGDVLQGVLHYDPTGVPDSSNPLIGRYNPRGALTLVGAREGLALPLSQVTVIDDRFDEVSDGHDRLQASVGITTSFGLLLDVSLALDSSVAGGGTKLPRSTSDLLARFDRGPFSFFAFPPDEDDPSHVLFGQGSLVRSAQTPEPASLLLLGSGVCTLMVGRRKRQRANPIDEQPHIARGFDPALSHPA